MKMLKFESFHVSASPVHTFTIYRFHGNMRASIVQINIRSFLL